MSPVKIAIKTGAAHDGGSSRMRSSHKQSKVTSHTIARELKDTAAFNQRESRASLVSRSSRASRSVLCSLGSCKELSHFSTSRTLTDWLSALLESSNFAGRGVVWPA